MKTSTLSILVSLTANACVLVFSDDSSPDPTSCRSLCDYTCVLGRDNCLRSASFVSVGPGYSGDVSQTCMASFNYCSNICGGVCACADRCDPICVRHSPECDLEDVDSRYPQSSITGCQLQYGSCDNYCMGVCATAVTQGVENPTVFDESIY